MKCLDCASFSFNRASPELARAGKGACAHHIPELAYDAQVERDCPSFIKAVPLVIGKREKWLKGTKV